MASIAPWDAPSDLITKTTSDSKPSLTSTPIKTTATQPINSLNTPVKPGTKLQPRIDVEQIYISLREGLGDSWAVYSDAIRTFLRGLSNRAELTQQLDPLLVKPELQRLHNQYFFAVEANATREVPETDVATWVSHQGKTNLLPKAVTGDAHERRLKKEVMSLPARDRRRMKEIPEGNEDLNNTIQRHHLAKQLKHHDPSFAPMSAGLNKNWQTELTAAYSAPLASESGEYMDTESILARCVPICYDEGLGNAMTDETARFVGLATDMFVREILTTLLTRIRLEPELRILKDVTGDKCLANGVLLKHKNSRSGSNNISMAERRGGTISMEHLRLSVAFSDNLIRQMPLSVFQILGGVNAYDRFEELEEDYWEEDEDDRRKRLKLEVMVRPTVGRMETGRDGDEMSAAMMESWENPASAFLMECLSGH